MIDIIYLQLRGPDEKEATWCKERIRHNDVEYIRKELYDELKNQITAYQLAIANMESAQQIPEEVSHHDPLHYGETDWCRGYNACISDMLSARKGES